MVNEDAKARLAEKYRRIASDWYKEQQKIPLHESLKTAEPLKTIEPLKTAEPGGAEENKNAEKEGPKTSIAPDESDEVDQELALVKELRQALSEKQCERRDVFDGVLSVMQHDLEQGFIPQNLPVVVRNMARRNEIKSDVFRITRKYGVAGANFAYLWGLDG